MLSSPVMQPIEGRLAGAVRTDEPVHFTGQTGQRDRIERLHAAEVLRQARTRAWRRGGHRGGNIAPRLWHRERRRRRRRAAGRQKPLDHAADSLGRNHSTNNTIVP